MSALQDRRDTLYERLERGYERIERGLREGREVTAWENLWTELLNEYEQVCDQLTADLAAGPAHADQMPPAQAALFDTSRRAETGGR